MTEEQRIQTALIKWTQQPDVRSRWPDLKLLYHVPNERRCTPQQGAMLKAMGVKSGVPDLCLPVARGAYHGLYIELKSTSKSARASEAQIWWIEELLAHGYAAIVCKGFDAAVEALTAYMDWRRPSAASSSAASLSAASSSAASSSADPQGGTHDKSRV